MPSTKKSKSGANFFDDVYEVVRLIPKGKVTSYGAIANYLGTKGSARMVGWALNGCPKNVPAHRVVNSAGLLTGRHHFKTPNEMQRRLEKEGVKIVKNQVKNFVDIFWNPSVELM